jgi:hypothetical protein
VRPGTKAAALTVVLVRGCISRCRFVAAVHLCVQEPNLLPGLPVVLVSAAELGGGEVARERHPTEELDVRRVPVGVVRRALPKLHAVGQVCRGHYRKPFTLRQTFFHRFCMEVIPFHVVC